MEGGGPHRLSAVTAAMVRPVGAFPWEVGALCCGRSWSVNITALEPES